MSQLPSGSACSYNYECMNYISPILTCQSGVCSCPSGYYWSNSYCGILISYTFFLKISFQIFQALITCPSGWTYYNSNCYQIFSTTMYQWSAQAYCPQQLSTAYLIEITSQAEFNWVSSFVQTYASGMVWVSNF